MPSAAPQKLFVGLGAATIEDRAESACAASEEQQRRCLRCAQRLLLPAHAGDACSAGWEKRYRGKEWFPIKSPGHPFLALAACAWKALRRVLRRLDRPGRADHP